MSRSTVTKLRGWGAMSDFTDDDDRQLVQLALISSRSRRQILWDRITQQMKGTKKSKEALRQRLKTLKRTHGRNLENFPVWYFRKKFATKINPQWLRHESANMKTVSEGDKMMLTLRGNQHKSQEPGRRKTMDSLQLNTPSIQTLMKLNCSTLPMSLQTSSYYSKRGKAELQASAPALLLLANVAIRNLRDQRATNTG